MAGVLRMSGRGGGTGLGWPNCGFWPVAAIHLKQPSSLNCLEAVTQSPAPGGANPKGSVGF